ncbi:enoyl-CoA hydratase/isomerase family protein [Yoonia sediminilitoris]|uniref:3-hydroxyisobutyryl-CoA hydrolase n=1 Tax=Yoonia sediminilitoris TaxID=1286148 RepID=A0A2T6KRI5_9RHOB|nr:enoyl-CoA hydratase/isomerase family protein [Yoonia sediminilitoris]PUB19157.1 enoyl-CoA hydratase [Yoonia sediminilitoris]RCW99325.1 enoyl-CoA hydratase [Yoonia sediminilitoris]
MPDISIRKAGRTGRITLNRPKAMNALTWDMCLAIEQALDCWRDDDAVQMVLIDAMGDKAFCAGGDIAEMYATATQGDYDYGQRFWRDEYRLNAKMDAYPKPIVTFLQGFTMGGGVGVGCHASHRIVCENSQIAMPECTIGLVPDVGGSLLLAKAPGHWGEYLGLTGTRMGPADAIEAGFADSFVASSAWDALKTDLEASGDPAIINAHTTAPDQGTLSAQTALINRHFSATSLPDIARSLASDDSDFAQAAHKALTRNAPLAMATALRIIRAVRTAPSIRNALDQEFRYTYRCGAQGDFVEGIRAAIIDRDRTPKWQHASFDAVPEEEIAAMRAPLGEAALQWEDTQ